MNVTACAVLLVLSTSPVWQVISNPLVANLPAAAFSLTLAVISIANGPLPAGKFSTCQESLFPLMVGVMLALSKTRSAGRVALISVPAAATPPWLP
jgi:hypothetical protein